MLGKIALARRLGVRDRDQPLDLFAVLHPPILVLTPLVSCLHCCTFVAADGDRRCVSVSAIHAQFGVLSDDRIGRTIAAECSTAVLVAFSVRMGEWVLTTRNIMLMLSFLLFYVEGALRPSFTENWSRRLLASGQSKPNPSLDSRAKTVTLVPLQPTH